MQTSGQWTDTLHAGVVCLERGLRHPGEIWALLLVGPWCGESEAVTHCWCGAATSYSAWQPWERSWPPKPGSVAVSLCWRLLQEDYCYLQGNAAPGWQPSLALHSSLYSSAIKEFLTRVEYNYNRWIQSSRGKWRPIKNLTNLVGIKSWWEHPAWELREDRAQWDCSVVMAASEEISVCDFWGGTC